MIFLIILLVYSTALWRMSVPMTGDQKVYLSVALEMKERGSFLIPYLFDRPNFLKPPFQYWMTLLGWDIFGISVLGAMLPSVLALVASAYLVKKLSPAKDALSAIVFSSTLATMTYGTTAQMEIWIVLFYLGAWIFYLENKLFWAFFTVGVMAWIKGPLYPALFVFSIGLKAYLDKNLIQLTRPKFIGALVLGITIGLSWYAAAAYYQFELLRDVFLGRENFGKIQTSQGSPLGLWSEFLGTLFPISFLILASVADPAFRERWKNQKTFWLSYALIPAVFFTVFPYRVNTYLYLLTPVIAWFALSDPKPRRSLRIAIQVVVSLMTLSAFVFIFRMGKGGWISPLLATSFALTFAFWMFSHFKMNAKWIALASLVLVNLVRIGATEIGEWDLKPLRETQVSSIAYLIQPNQEDIWHEFGLVSAALGRPIARVRSDDEEKVFLEKGGTVILSDEQNPVPGAQCAPWRRLKRRIKFPIKQLLESGLSIEDPDLHRQFRICSLTK